MEPGPGNTPGTHEALRSALFGVCTALGVDDETGENHAYVRTTEGAIAKLGPKLVGTAVFVVPANDYLRLLSADKPPPRSKDGLACHFCKCTLLPVLSKAEPIGVDGLVKATCHQCGKFTARYANQWDAIFAWADGHWAG